MHPKLTVGVPHLDRTEFLAETIDCLLAQTTPCRILVADQGKTDATFELMQRYTDNPLVCRVPTKATCLWENWRAAAEIAMDGGAEYFAWCQDDDVVHPRYAERIVAAFDTYPRACIWMAHLAVAEHKRLALRSTAFGPPVPADLLCNLPAVIPGEMLTPAAYFSSFALSPAVAFRCGDDFRDALAEVPTRCDLYTERTILAAMGRKGDAACDPVLIGLWRHHGKNESFRQNVVEKPEQLATFIDWIDAMMDGLPEWDRVLLEWASIMPPNHLQGYLAVMEGLDSRHVHAVADVLSHGMRDVADYDELRRRLNPQPDHPVIV